jgi:hypothetical protein
MKKLFAVILLLAVGFSSHSQSKKAFIVTIGDYPAQNGWSDLSSSKDKEIVMDLLLSQGFDASSIVSLTDQNATYSGFKTAVTSFIASLQKGDVIYFHFSGHGQQVMDVSSKDFKTEFLDQDEPDGWDEALVLYNAPMKWTDGYKFEEHLVDDQINHYFNSIREKIGGTGQLIAVFDACHSGTISRGENDWVVRGTNKVCAPENYNPTLVSNDKSNSDFAFENKSEMGKLVCFFGCQPHQVNRELNKAGSLTTFFASAMKELKENATYNNLFSLINEGMAVNFQNAQHPDIEGDDLNQLIFSGKFIAQDKFVLCDKLVSNSAYLKGGTINGLAIGDSIGFFSNTTNQINGTKPLFKGIVSEIDALNSKVTLTTKNNERGEKFRAFVICKSIAPASLDIALDAGALNKELKQLLENKKNIQLVEGKAKYVIKKYTADGETSKTKVQIFIGDGDLSLPLKEMSGLDISTHQGKDSLLLLLSYASRSEVFRELEWYDDNFKVDYKIQKGVKNSKNQFIAFPDASHNNEVSLSKNEVLEVIVENNGSKIIIFNVVSLDPNGIMTWFDKSEPNCKIRPGEKTRLYVNCGTPYGMEMLKFISSYSNIDLSAINEMGKSLINRGGESPLFSLIGDASTGSRGAVDSSSNIIINNFTFLIKE